VISTTWNLEELWEDQRPSVVELLNRIEDTPASGHVSYMNHQLSTPPVPVGLRITSPIRVSSYLSMFPGSLHLTVPYPLLQQCSLPQFVCTSYRPCIVTIAAPAKWSRPLTSLRAQRDQSHRYVISMRCQRFYRKDVYLYCPGSRNGSISTLPVATTHP